jgi:hypothetical protein
MFYTSFEKPFLLLFSSNTYTYTYTHTYTHTHTYLKKSGNVKLGSLKLPLQQTVPKEKLDDAPLQACVCVCVCMCVKIRGRERDRQMK